MQTHPYLNFDGRTEEAFRFYAECFGRELGPIHRFGDMPMEGVEYSDEDARKVMHVRLDIADGQALMGSDTLPAHGHTLTVGNNVYLSLHPETREEGQRLFEALSAGGRVEMPFSEVPWGAYWGSFADRYGIQWMVNWDKPQP